MQVSISALVYVGACVQEIVNVSEAGHLARSSVFSEWSTGIQTSEGYGQFLRTEREQG